MDCRVWYKNTRGYYVCGWSIGDCIGECFFCGSACGFLSRGVTGDLLLRRQRAVVLSTPPCGLVRSLWNMIVAGLVGLDQFDSDEHLVDGFVNGPVGGNLVSIFHCFFVSVSR